MAGKLTCHYSLLLRLVITLFAFTFVVLHGEAEAQQNEIIGDHISDSSSVHTPGIIIINGAPYDNSINSIKLMMILVEKTNRYTKHLQESLEKRGIPTHTLTIQSKSIDVHTAIGLILSEHNADGLIQVKAFTTGVDTGQQIVIAPYYTTLTKSSETKYIVGSGLRDRIIVYDTKDSSRKHIDLALLADGFAEKLKLLFYRR